MSAVSVLDELGSRIDTLSSSLEREKGAAQALQAKADTAAQRALQAEHKADVCEQAGKFLAQFADERQAQVIEVIQSIASVGLTQVFDEPIELKIEQVARARRVEMDITVKTGNLETPILEARGGGLAAVAGFLLRASVLLLTPGARKLLVLDETFAMLSSEYLDRMGQFLHELCERTGLQIITVTHQNDLAQAADKVIRIERTSPNTSRLVVEK